MNDVNYTNLVDEEIIVTLTTMEDEEVECLALCKIKIEEQEYIALLPLMEDGSQNPDGDVIFYTFAVSESNDPILGDIEDDEIYEEVSLRFDNWLDLMEQNEVQEALDAEE
ncbi:MAG: DUF1292 domain-containing protein [Hespellia sp.]|nr:DUF1292 domain-containing protein [Hespellia sp.]